jgi:hypothetical protein
MSNSVDLNKEDTQNVITEKDIELIKCFVSEVMSKNRLSDYWGKAEEEIENLLKRIESLSKNITHD